MIKLEFESFEELVKFVIEAEEAIRDEQPKEPKASIIDTIQLNNTITNKRNTTWDD